MQTTKTRCLRSSRVRETTQISTQRETPSLVSNPNSKSSKVTRGSQLKHKQVEAEAIKDSSSEDSLLDSEFNSEADLSSCEDYMPPTKSKLNSNSRKISKTQKKKGEDTKKKSSKGRKNPWQPEEDAQALKLIEQLGMSWAKIANIIGNRTGKQVRDRYLNYLRSDINNSEFTPEEDERLMSLCKELGNKWCKIAEFLPGRSECQVKNRYYAHIRKNVPKTKTSNKKALKENDESRDTEDYAKENISIKIDSSITEETGSPCSTVKADEGNFFQKERTNFNYKFPGLTNLIDDPLNFISYQDSTNDYTSMLSFGNDTSRLEFERKFEMISKFELNFKADQLESIGDYSESTPSSRKMDFEFDDAQNSQKQETLKNKKKAIEYFYAQTLQEISYLEDISLLNLEGF